MNVPVQLIKQGTIEGLKKGWNGFIWILKIIIPISFATVMLEWSGLIRYLDFLLQPMMGWLHLPAIAALPLIIGMAAGIYGALGAMSALPFSQAEVTLIAIFLLIAHNLIQESIIQGQSGFHPGKATLARIGAAMIAVWIAAQILIPNPVGQGESGTYLQASVPLLSSLKNWALSTFYLLLKIFGILMAVLIAMGVLRALNWIQYGIKALSPLLKVMGLSQKVGFVWGSGAVFGLVLGSAVILEEAKAGHISKKELEEVHLSIGIQHSLFEDPFLFLAMGLNPFWLWVPRLVMAILAVQVYNLWHKIRGR
jgi:hypothetical protein